MLKMRVHGLIAGGVTLVHFDAAVHRHLDLAVIGARPEHARAMGEAESAVIAPCGPGFTVLAYLPALAGTGHVWRARSGLMRVQLWP